MKYLAALEEYRLHCRARGANPKTWRWYSQHLGVFGTYLKDDLGLVEVEGLRAAHVHRFIEWLQVTPSLNGRGIRSSYTVKAYVESIKVFMSFLVEEGLLDAEHRARVKNPKVSKRIIKTISREQFGLLMDATSGEPSRTLQLRNPAILALLMATGIRANELCTLKYGDVHFGDADESYILVHGKRDKEREVGPLGVICQKHLRRYLRGQERKPEDTIFLGRTGEPLTPSGLDRLLYRLRDRAGAEEFSNIRLSAHTFRHTFAVNYLKQGGDIKRLQLLLGHSSLTVTQHYLEDFQQRDARRGLSVLDQF